MNAKLTKGLAAAAISAAMMLGAAAPALAETTYGKDDMSKVELTKTYTANTDNGAVAPSEAFKLSNLTADNDAAKNFKLNGVVALPTVEATTAINGTSTNYFKIDLPAYDQVGVYTYKFSEIAGKTAGVTYDPTEYVLKVTVTNELGADKVTPTGKLVRSAVVRKATDTSVSKDTKVTSIANSYEANTLTVGKSVKGILGDTTKEFTLNVEFTKPDGTDWTNAISTDKTGDATVTRIEGTDKYTVKVKDGETVTFKNVPDNAKYTVTEAEADKDGYTTTGQVQEAKELAANGTETVTNTKGGDVDTGVLLNNAPYIAILGGAAVVAIYVVNKRRHSDMD